MLNDTRKFVVYLDPDTLEYMYLNYTKKRKYPVMNKLYTLLHEGFVNNLLVVPLSMDHLLPYIKENQIDSGFINMMGELGQVRFLQRFTVKTLQLIRIINRFFDHNYSKPVWKDAFSTDPDEKYCLGFNKYNSITVQNVLKAYEREKKHSQLYDFIESYKNEKPVESVAGSHFNFLWEQFSDLIKPYLPKNGEPEFHIKSFLEYGDIKEIPEFHIASSILYPIIEAYGIGDIEYGLKDEVLFAAENVAAYMPFCHFYVTTVDIVELVVKTKINEMYYVKVYDHNESSLYKFIKDLSEATKAKREFQGKEMKKTIFRRDNR